jgi:hypothetical protein
MEIKEILEITPETLAKRQKEALEGNQKHENE